MKISEETFSALGQEARPKQYRAQPRIKKTDKKKQIITYAITPTTHRRMKLYALENNTSLQQIIDEAMDLFFADKGEPPIEKIGESDE